MQKMLTRFTFLFILSCLLIPSQNQAHASHFMGIDVQVECINSCTVRVEWRGYRDCSGSSILTPNSLTWTPTVANCNAPTMISGWSFQIQTEVTPICPSVQTMCTNTGATINGVQEYYNYADYDICTGINANCEWNLEWSSCCRNAVITSGAANQSMSISNHYSITQGCNNSPEYMNTPLFYACAGTTSSIFMGGVDPDGDSLTYSLTPCISTQGNNVTYNAGYSATQPLGPNWNVTLDPISGILTLNPQVGTIVVGVVCITTSEWRNGVLIGQNTRDIQVAILSCPANNPAFMGPVTNVTGGSLTSPNVVTVCAGTPVCFEVEGFDPDTTSGQVVSILWDESISGATFTQTGNPAVTDTVIGNSPNATFCWSNPVAGVYPIRIGLRDNGCPIFSYGDETIYLEVTGGNFVATINSTAPSINTCTGNPVTLSVAGGPYNSYLWSTGATTPTIDVTVAGTYSCSVTLGTCNASGMGSIAITTTSLPNVTGTVTLSNGTTPMANSLVYLIAHDSTLNSLTGLDTTTTDSAGYYEFCVTGVDTFYLKAAPDSASYPNHLPTYADTAVYFNNAAFFETVNTPMTVDWSVKSGANPGGPGFIGGLITQGANKRQGVGDPMPDRQVFLYSVTLGQFIGTTVTDSSGYFSFPNLPLGDFEISVDAPGVDEVNVPMVTLNTQIPVQDSLDLRLHSTYLELVIPTNLIDLPVKQDHFVVYPNPAENEQVMQLTLAEESEVEISIFDIAGKEVRKVLKDRLPEGTQTYLLKSLPSGAYFIKVRINDSYQVHKIVRW